MVNEFVVALPNFLALADRNYESLSATGGYYLSKDNAVDDLCPFLTETDLVSALNFFFWL